MMKQQFILTSAFLIALLMLASVSASGVAIPYMENKILKMNPGESKVIQFTLQNMQASEDVIYKVSVTSGVARIVDPSDTYIVPMNTANTRVNLQINVPANAAIGTIYPVKAAFNTVISGSGEGVAMATGMDVSFNVLVEEKQETEEKPAAAMPNTNLIVAIVIIVIALILWLLLRKKK